MHLKAHVPEGPYPVSPAVFQLSAQSLPRPADLKPANVLLKSSRRDSRGFTCKLADFGYVSVLKPTVPGGRPTILPEEACGTVTHMAVGAEGLKGACGVVHVSMCVRRWVL